MRIGLVGVGRIGAFHAATLVGLEPVEQVVIADADPDRARAVAQTVGATFVPDVATLLASGVDGLVIAATTGAHADLLLAGQDAGLPTFCEKPISIDLQRSCDVVRRTAKSRVPVQVGFQRRFDAGYRGAAESVRNGQVGWIHSIRANTCDMSPPGGEFLAGSGGFFRDCSVHDFDAVRFVTGCEVVSAVAYGANRGEEFVAEADDIDTAAAVLTLDDGTVVFVSGSRYNAAGYDVRMEIMGSQETIMVGLDDRAPVRSSEADTSFPRGPAHESFLERFRTAYVAEMAGFTDLVAGRTTSQCTLQDALQAARIAEACEISRRADRRVYLSEVQ